MKKKQAYFFTGFLLLCILAITYYLSALFAEGVQFSQLEERIAQIKAAPFENYWNSRTPLFLFLGLGIGIYVIANLIDLTGNFMFGKEYGTAKWGKISGLNRRLAADGESENHILTDKLRVSYDPAKTDMNNNQVILGGSGKGKGFRVIFPNLLNGHGAYVITDAKGDTLHTIGNYMAKILRYDVRVINLIDFIRSLHYNPFVYLKEEEDVAALVENIMENTKKNDRQVAADPFWEDGPMMLLISIFHYVWMECSKNCRNWRSVFYYLDMVTVGEEKSPFERLIDHVAANSELGADHPAVKNFRIFKSGAQETMQSILAILYARLKIFRQENVLWLTEYDETNLYDIGLGVHGNPDKKVALFVLIPDEKTLYNPIVGMLYTQLFQLLFSQARECGGKLPYDVGFYLDEYANIKMPGDFIHEIATIRSRRIYAKIFIQGIKQMQLMHKDDWETVFGNCDTLVYLGSGEKSSYEYMSELIGDFTLNKRSKSRTYGAHGSASSSVDSLGRNLITKDELRRMKKNQCIVLLSGEDPVMDKKYQTQKDERFKQAVALGVYDPPVRVQRSGLRFIEQPHLVASALTPEEVAYYQTQQERGMVSQYLVLDEKALLYMDLEDDRSIDEEVLKAFIEEHKGIFAEMDQEEEKGIDLSFGSAYDWINRYPLTPEQTEEVIRALEDGMTDEEIRTFYNPEFSAQKMNQMRRLLLLQRKRGDRNGLG